MSGESSTARTSSIVERRILIVIHQIHICASLQEHFHTLKLSISACKVQGGAALMISLILVSAFCQMLLQGISIACAQRTAVY
jgi:hypothetical protein